MKIPLQEQVALPLEFLVLLLSGFAGWDVGSWIGGQQLFAPAEHTDQVHIPNKKTSNT